MIALFPTFGKIAKKIKQALSTDVDSLWQLLQDANEDTTVYAIGDCIYW